MFCHINGEQQTSVAQAFSVSGFPDIRFLRADGSQVSQILGYEDTPQFVADMEKARGAAGM